MIKTAVISTCGKYRYQLTRHWADGAPVVFVMLNPSTADGSYDDPTIRKCVAFADRYGYGGIIVVNLFAYRATRPTDLWAHQAAGGDIRGPDNWEHFHEVFPGRDVILAWGANASKCFDYSQEVHGRAGSLAKSVSALRMTKDGLPCHPLMLPYSCKRIAL